MSSRREFVKKSALLGAGITLAPQISLAENTFSTKEKLNIGLIGVGLRGTNHLTNILYRNDCNITAICDIDPRRNEIALGLISKAGWTKPQVFDKNEYDYRNLLELENVDAVIISTPWLWHTRMAKDAMKA